MMHCRQCHSLSCAIVGAKALWMLGVTVHAHWAPSLWRRRKPWCRNCVYSDPAQMLEWLGEFATGGSLTTTALIAWAIVSVCSLGSGDGAGLQSCA